MTGDLTSWTAESENDTGADDGESNTISDINRLVTGRSVRSYSTALVHATQSFDEVPAEIVGIVSEFTYPNVDADTPLVFSGFSGGLSGVSTERIGITVAWHSQQCSRAMSYYFRVNYPTLLRR